MLVTICGADGNATCAVDDRLCVSTDGVEECGNCVIGFLDLLAPSNTTCLNVTAFTWNDYVELHDPFYRDDDGEDATELQALQAERLQKLHEELYEASVFNAQFPPPAFKLGCTDYSADVDDDEDDIRGLHINASNYVNLEDLNFTQAEMNSVPDSINWVDRGAVSSVKKQGRCGCCWALATIQAIESAAFLNNGTMIELSFQQLISCDKEELEGLGRGNQGCDGGWMINGLLYAATNSFGGITSQVEYPYTDFDGVETNQCLLDSNKQSVIAKSGGPVVVFDYRDPLLLEARQREMKAALTSQPVSVAMRSECCIFKNYQRGILTLDEGCECNSPQCIDHAVLLVGYNDTHETPYWLIKNSWGTDWGEDGYVRIAQGTGAKDDGLRRPYGLFGLLGVGIIPLEAIKLQDAPPTSSSSGQRPSSYYYYLLSTLVLMMLFTR